MTCDIRDFSKLDIRRFVSWVQIHDRYTVHEEAENEQSEAE